MESKKANKPISFEINLVPDIKGEVLKKRKLQVWVIAGCVLLSGACAAVILSLVSVLGVQSLQLSGIDNEIACRNEGTGKECNTGKHSYGTPIAQTSDLNSILTIKSEMDGLGKLNSNKTDITRVFDLLPVLAMRDADSDPTIPSVEYKSFNIEYGNTTAELTVDFVGYDNDTDAIRGNIAYKTAERFSKNVPKIYYDYGRYMRVDKDGNPVEIPTYCILAEVDDDRGIRYGIYMKGIPGCEAPMTRPKSNETIAGQEGEEPDDIYSKHGEFSYLDCGTYNIECFLIRRTYIDRDDKDRYKNKEDIMATEEFSITEIDAMLEALGFEKINKNLLKRDAVGYYFESQCIGFDTEGKIDEDGALGKCPLVSSDFDPEEAIGDVTQTTDQATGRASADISLDLSVNMDIFRSSTKHVVFYGPSRRNVTDSYVQIRDMYNLKESSSKESE